MTNKNNRKCICCSTEYRYCNTCSEDALKPAWHSIYCSENCKKLFQAVSGYLANAVSIEETRARFDDCDLSYKKNLKDTFIKVIDEVYEVKSEFQTVTETETEIEVKTEIKDELTEEIVEDAVEEDASQSIEDTVVEEATEEVKEKTKEEPKKKKGFFGRLFG